MSPERENPLAQDPQKLAGPLEPLAPSISAPVAGLGRRLLRLMGVWLQSKADDKAGAAGSARPASPDMQPVPEKNEVDYKTHLVPEAVARRFLNVDRDYYFPDKTHAFADRGVKLATRGAHPEVVRTLIEIAKARGWDSITVKGTEEFRRSAWMEAAQAGLQVAGYKPTALDLAELASKPANNWVEKAGAKVRDVAPARQWGRLSRQVPHGGGGNTTDRSGESNGHGHTKCRTS